MATNTASIEKIVRRVLDEELDERNQVTLEAIEQLSRVLTEDVIPRLPDAASAGELDEPPSDASERPRAMRAGYSKPGIEDSAEDADMPDDEPAAGVPPAVSEALEAVYSSLSAEQASALEELFAAIAQEQADEDDEGEAPPVERPSHKPGRARLVS